MEGPHVAKVAALIGEPARANILVALMSGKALTATELAAVAGVSKQTASFHLSKLVDASLLQVYHQGRHRYHQLADVDVADLLERLMGVADRAGLKPLVTGPKDPELRKARVCYDHLAGELAVRCLDRLVERQLIFRDGLVVDGAPELRVTEAGRGALAALGLTVEAPSRRRRPLCRACLDWSVRRHHLSGALGAEVLRFCLARRWAKRVEGSRVVRFSPKGEASFVATFCA